LATLAKTIFLMVILTSGFDIAAPCVGKLSKKKKKVYLIKSSFD
jgi:hypothetical protein